MKWAVRVAEPLRNVIMVCACGGKYIKTRVGQIACVRCLLKKRDAK